MKYRYTSKLGPSIQLAFQDHLCVAGPSGLNWWNPKSPWNDSQKSCPFQQDQDAVSRSLTSQHLSSPRMANIFHLIDSEVGQCRFWPMFIWTVGHFTIITTIVNSLLIFYNYCAKFFSVLGECTGTATALPKNKYNTVCVLPSVLKLETSCSIVKFSSNTNSNHTRNLSEDSLNQQLLSTCLQVPEYIKSVKKKIYIYI